MVNGNDLLEYEQENEERLTEEFILKYEQAFAIFCVSDEDIVNRFKKKESQAWTDFVMEDFNNRGI